MGTIHEATTAKASQGRGMVRSLYEAALREVEADPAAAVHKYQPKWFDALSPRCRAFAERPAARSTER